MWDMPQTTGSAGNYRLWLTGTCVRVRCSPSRLDDRLDVAFVSAAGLGSGTEVVPHGQR